MDMKESARTLNTMAETKKVRFPLIWDDFVVEKKRIQDCGATIMMHRNDDGSFDLHAALETLVEKYGCEEDNEKKRKKTTDSDNLPEEIEGASEQKGKQQKIVHVACEENRAIALAIQEIAGIYFKNNDMRKGGVFSKAAKALRECETEIKTSKEAQKLKGIGKGIAGYIEEYVTTGCIGKLEELRAGTA